MKVALCIPHLPLSGVGTSVGILHDGLKEAGYEVDVIITGNSPGADLAYANTSGWNTILTGTGKRFLPDRMKGVVEQLNRGGYGILLNNMSMEAQLALPCLRRGLLRVGVMRGLNDDALWQVGVNSAYLHALVGISEEMVRVMTADRRIQSPVRLIPNCTRAVEGEPPRIGGRMEICYVGRLAAKDKNVMILPEIAAELRRRGAHFRLRIVGDGPDAGSLRASVRRLSLKEVEFCGAMEREAATGVLRSSHFTLLPSVSEGLSNVMLEGMATGCIPICSDIPNFRWVLGEAAEQLQCALNDPREYARRMLLLWEHRDSYMRLQASLHHRQREAFTPERTMGKYIDLFRELASGGARSLPPAFEFRALRMPWKYRVHCSPLWRVLQFAKDVCYGRGERTRMCESQVG